MFSRKHYFSQFWTPAHWANSGQYSDARFFQLSDLDTVRSLGVLPSYRINYVEVQAEEEDVRYRDDGIAPTADIGMILYAGAAPTRFAGGSIGLLKFIETTTSAKLNVRFY